MSTKCLTTPEAKKIQKKRLLELAEGPLLQLEKHPIASKLSLNDNATWQWLWKKYTKKPWDPDFQTEITRNDVARFKEGMNEFLSNVGKKQNIFSKYFKLPRAIAKHFPQGSDFITEVSETIAFGERQLKTNSNHIDFLMKGFSEMIKDPYSPIVNASNLTKAEIKAFRGWEQTMADAKTSKQKAAALKEIRNLVGDAGTKEEPVLGQVMRRFRSLLTGVTESGKEIVLPIKESAVENRIAKEWDIMRANTMKDLLNGAINTKQLIRMVGDGNVRKDLDAAHDRVTSAINRLLAQSEADQRVFQANYAEKNGVYYPVDGMRVYDPVKKKNVEYKYTNEAGETVIAKGIQKYSPTYVIELSGMLNDLMLKARTYKDSEGFGGRIEKGITSADLLKKIEDATTPQALSDRLKYATEHDNRASLDPYYYLNKYAHDVASFNTSARVNLHFAKHTKTMVDAIRKINTLKDIEKRPELDEYANQVLNMLFEVRENSIGKNRSQQGSVDDIVRLINAFEYISKMGFSVKSATKNLTQWSFNWYRYGYKGIKRSRQWKNLQSRPADGPNEAAYNNSTILERQKKKYALLIGEKKAAAGIAAATAGSLDQIMVPKGFDIAWDGTLIRAEKPSTAKALLKETSRAVSNAAEISSKRTIFGTKAMSMQWTENFNRIQTFDIAFADSYMRESTPSRLSYHERMIKREKGDPNYTVTSKELYDRVENISGNVAKEMVTTFHFDYNNWAKSRILRGKMGKVFGQYQHFTFAYFDLVHGIWKEAYKDVKGFRFTEKMENPMTGNVETVVSPAIMEAMRMTSMHALIPGVIGMLNFDIGGFWSTMGMAPPFAAEEDKKRMARTTGSSGGQLLEDPILNHAKRIYDWYTSDYEYDVNKSHQENMKLKEIAMDKKWGAFYGKHIATAFLGPAVSDVLTYADIMDRMDMSTDEYQERHNMAYDPNNPEWWYNVARIFNVEAARGAFSTFKGITQQNPMYTFRSQFGLWTPSWMKTTKDNIWGWVQDNAPGGMYGKPSTKRPKRISKKRAAELKEDERQKALRSLSYL